MNFMIPSYTDCLIEKVLVQVSLLFSVILKNAPLFVIS